LTRKWDASSREAERRSKVEDAVGAVDVAERTEAPTGRGRVVAQVYSVDDAFNAWLNSPGHRDNILDPDYRDLGLGLAVGAGYDAAPGGYRVVWVQSFGLGE